MCMAAGCAVLNGIIYVCGGEDGEDYVSSVECFDPLAGVCRIRVWFFVFVCHGFNVCAGDASLIFRQC